MLEVIVYLNICILIYFGFLSIWYIYILIRACPVIINSYRETQYGNIDHLMLKSTIPITIIVPAYNEEKRILDCLYSILKNTYQNIQIIVVNDGSTDNTLDLLINEFSLYKIPPVIRETIKTSPVLHLFQSKIHHNLTVIDKEHGPFGNAADANNVGLNATSTPIVATVDADTILEPKAVANIMYDFLSVKNVVSVGGIIQILNGNQYNKGELLTKNLSNKPIPAMQAIEYFRAFTCFRAGLNGLAGAMSYAGAFTLFEVKALKEYGGFDTENFAYDTEIIMRMHERTRFLKYPTQVKFSSKSIGWTVVPETLRVYWYQRNHWQRGILRSVCKYKSMLFNPKYGIVGFVTFPCYIFFEVLGPIVEFFAYFLLLISVLLKIVIWQDALWYVFFAWGYVVLLTIIAFYINMVTSSAFSRFLEMIRVVWLTTIEMLGFRQFRAACCFWATLQFCWNRLRGKPL